MISTTAIWAALGVTSIVVSFAFAKICKKCDDRDPLDLTDEHVYNPPKEPRMSRYSLRKQMRMYTRYEIKKIMVPFVAEVDVESRVSLQTMMEYQFVYVTDDMGFSKVLKNRYNPEVMGFVDSHKKAFRNV